MPFDRKKYPANWEEIRTQILERAQHRCEQCGVPNHVWVIRNPDKSHWPPEGKATERDMRIAIKKELGIDSPYGLKPIRIVLTIAHIENPDPVDVRPENLKALCQLHHLQHDAKQHGINSAATRAKKKKQQLEKEGQLSWI